MKEFVCGICEASFPLKMKLFQHKKKVHLNNLKIKVRQNTRENSKAGSKCNSCGKYFPCKYTLNRHINSVHLKLKPYKCDNCDISFSRNDTLQGHIRLIHENDRSQPCRFK